MADPIYLVRGDTGPQIKVTLTRTDTGLPQDISEASVNLHFRKKFTETVLFTLAGQPFTEGGVEGTVVFLFGSGQLDLPAGEYEGEVEVVYNAGGRETVFETVNFELRKDFA